MKLAVVSPNENVYSESFIQAHKRITENTLYFYGGNVPYYLEGYGKLLNGWGRTKYLHYLKRVVLSPRILLYPKAYGIDKRMLAEEFRRRKVTHVLAEFGNCAVGIMDICSNLNIKLISHFHGYEISTYDITSVQRKFLND